jgi:hypothetical protein
VTSIINNGTPPGERDRFERQQMLALRSEYADANNRDGGFRSDVHHRRLYMCAF